MTEFHLKRQLQTKQFMLKHFEEDSEGCSSVNSFDSENNLKIEKINKNTINLNWQNKEIQKKTFQTKKVKQNEKIEELLQLVKKLSKKIDLKKYHGDFESGSCQQTIKSNGNQETIDTIFKQTVKNRFAINKNRNTENSNINIINEKHSVVLKPILEDIYARIPHENSTEIQNFESNFERKINENRNVKINRQAELINETSPVLGSPDIPRKHESENLDESLESFPFVSYRNNKSSVFQIFDLNKSANTFDLRDLNLKRAIQPKFNLKIYNVYSFSKPKEKTPEKQESVNSELSIFNNDEFAEDFKHETEEPKIGLFKIESDYEDEIGKQLMNTFNKSDLKNLYLQDINISNPLEPQNHMENATIHSPEISFTEKDQIDFGLNEKQSEIPEIKSFKKSFLKSKYTKKSDSEFSQKDSMSLTPKFNSLIQNSKCSVTSNLQLKNKSFLPKNEQDSNESSIQKITSFGKTLAVPDLCPQICPQTLPNFACSKNKTSISLLNIPSQENPLSVEKIGEKELKKSSFGIKDEISKKNLAENKKNDFQISEIENKIGFYVPKSSRGVSLPLNRNIRKVNRIEHLDIDLTTHLKRNKNEFKSNINFG